MNKKNRISPAIKWVFSIFVLIAMIIALVFGTIFYLNPTLKNNNPTNNNIVGTKAVLKIAKDKYQSSSKTDIAPNKIADTVKNYLQEKDDKLTSNFDVKLLSNDLIEIKSLLATDDKKQKQLLNSLVKKPYLTITDHNGNPLFYKGRYQGGESTFHGLQELIDKGSQNFNMDLDANPASDKIPQGYADRIQIKLNNYAWDQFTHLAYDYWIRGFREKDQNLEAPKNKVYFWLNLDEFIHNAIKYDKENWDKAKNNPVNYAYVNHNPGEEVTKDKKGNILSSLKPNLKYSINAQKYLISATSPVSLISSQKRDSIFYLINNSPNGYSNKQLTSLINFSYTPFILEKQAIYFETKSAKQFDSYILAIVIILIAMSIFLVVKHRLLGAIASVTMAFLLFVFLSIISAFGVVINSLIALTTIFIIFVAFSLLTKKLQIFSKELREGANTNKAINKATKRTFISGLDVIAILGIGSILAFYLNINHSSTIGALIGIGALLIAAIVIGLNTLLFKSFIQTESFDNKKHLITKTKLTKCKFIEKINILFKTKYFIIPLIILISVAIIIYALFAIKSQSALSGFNITNELSHKFIYNIGIDFKNSESLSAQSAIFNDLTEFITNSSKANVIIEKVKVNEQGLNSLLVYSNVNINDFINTELVNFFNSKNYLNVELVKSGNNLNNLYVGASIGWTALLIILINITVIVYITFRYSFQSALVYLIKQLLLISLVISSLIILRTKIDNFVFDGLLFISFINILDSIINASRIKAEIKKDINTKNFIYKPEQVNSIIKILLSDVIGLQHFNLFLGFILLSSAPFLLVNVSFNLILAFQLSLLFIWYLNLFIMPKIWEQLINIKFKNKQKRIENDFWKTEKIQEQTFIGINDFSM